MVLSACSCWIVGSNSGNGPAHPPQARHRLSAVNSGVFGLHSGTNGAEAAELGMFSTPHVIWNGVAVGDRTRGHCARAISETAPKVAAYYTRASQGMDIFCGIDTV